jgi:hypothetical protein
MAISRNPPAFPNDARIQLGDDYQGMTLRDYFAAAALPTIMQICRDDTDARGRDLPPYFAQVSYEIADAMIAEREKRDGKD